MNSVKMEMAVVFHNREMVSSQNNCNTAGQMAPLHWHDAYEILFVRSGWGEQQLNTAILPFHPGDVVFIKPGDLHGTCALSPHGACIDIIQFTHRFLMPEQNFIYKIDTEIIHPETEAVEYLFQTIQQNINQEQPGRDLLLSGAIQMLAGFLINASSPSRKRSVSAALEAVCTYLEQAGDLRLTQVASHFHYSAEHLSRKFHAETGVSYRQWCDKIRMNKATVLLNDGSHTISWVAEKLGFCNESSFIRAFKRNFGITPSAYCRHKSSAQTSPQLTATTVQESPHNQARTGDCDSTPSSPHP